MRQIERYNIQGYPMYGQGRGGRQICENRRLQKISYYITTPPSFSEISVILSVIHIRWADI